MGKLKNINPRVRGQQKTSGDLPFSPRIATTLLYEETSTSGQTVINLDFSVEQTELVKRNFLLMIDGKELREGATHDYEFTNISSNNTSSQITLNSSIAANLNIKARLFGLVIQNEPSNNNLQAQLNNLNVTTVTGNATVNASSNDFTVNVDAQTATITLPDGESVGTQRLIRKVNPNQGAITIDSAGSETFTRAGLSDVALNADGDYWLLEKVTTSRWDLLEGFETGSNSNGDYFRYADGTQRCSLFRLDTKKNTSWEFIGGLYDSNFDKTWTYPKPFESNVIGETILSDSAGSNSAIFAVKINRPNGTSSIVYEYWSSADFGNAGNNNQVNGVGLDIGVSLKATGRWYQ